MQDVLIRPATPRDATDLAVLIDMAGDGLPSYFWSKIAPPEQSPIEYGRSRSMGEDGAFSFRNAFIAEVGGIVAGGSISYRLDDPVDLSELDALHEIAQPIVRLEAKAAGHWYVNVLAVYPEFRRLGIATGLLNHAEMLGRTTDSPGMALIVASENDASRRLYERVGYREKARLPLVAYPDFKRGGDWVLLTKPHS